MKKEQDKDPLDEIALVRYARSGRDRGRRVDAVEDPYSKAVGTVHMVKGDKYTKARFYGKVGEVETELIDDVNVATEWVNRQLKRTRELEWKRVLYVRYNKAGKVQNSGTQRWDREARDFDELKDGKAEVELEVSVVMLALLPNVGWRYVDVDDFEEATDKLKAAKNASIPLDATLPVRLYTKDLYHDKNSLWMEYDEGLFQALSAIQAVIMNARRSIFDLLGDDDAVTQLAAVGASAVPKLLGAGK